MQTKPFFQTALSLSLALSLSACAVHSADQNLTLESTGQVMSAAETAERYDVNGNWWEIYQSPQLNALMAQALVDFPPVAVHVVAFGGLRRAHHLPRRFKREVLVGAVDGARA